MEAEGLKRRKHWTFQIVDSAGVTLIRLSTEVQSEYLAWLDALEQAGCARRAEADRSQGSYPGRGGTSPSASQQSDSDAGTGSYHQGVGGCGGGGEEVDSMPSPRWSGGGGGGEGEDRARPLLRQKSRGYTSDQSDVAHIMHPSQRAFGGGPGGDSGSGSRRREGMVASTPVHTAPHFSLLSSERITFSNQSGGCPARVGPVSVPRGLGSGRGRRDHRSSECPAMHPCLPARPCLLPPSNLGLPGPAWPVPT